MAAETQKRDIVIVGGGIIGATTAYYLSQHASFDRERDSITLLEATEIAGGASGKAGGLLALWAYPSCIVPLSFRLHKELADQHGGAERWGYRAVHCGQIDMYGVLKKAGEDGVSGRSEQSKSLQKRDAKALSLLRAAGVPPDLDWIAADAVQSYEAMGSPGETAQVHPYQFTTSMAALAEQSGARIVYGTATHIEKDSSAVTGVRYTPKHGGAEKTLHAHTVLITAGPWTQSIWPAAPISAMRAHSVTIKPTRPVSAYALFTSIELPRLPASKRGETVTPEIYARPNQEVYACGEGDQLVRLPASSDLVQVDDSRCQDIIDHVSTVSEELRDGEVTARQACYLPNVSRGQGPLIGETGVKGLLMGAGHTCWGIQNAPGTAKCLSELVWEGKVGSADLKSLDPRRVM
ncbi:FAD dependent oxidoreductase [Didymella exigua CBS 183.55]|uniref:FAD dependent oxidoreductase n=1 Tax=Didymella exigua CBS 183.55 TaxID=1150837 RepID=A0A6A5RLZ2_9PLEO|nr:FAD dependent oxidoreductase [Didymella exigua CBS 183.55]KAF1926547.1 FAD dependent oxidoreductase [Didymella exigua CBS 183.55]